jgi:tRNA-2-methylthio-N6-dimethylallyladenosine synthase
MSGKVLIKTHGCQMNEYDSAKMLDVLAEGCNLSVTDIETEADVLLLNTCSIREKAQENVFSQLPVGNNSSKSYPIWSSFLKERC